MSASLLLPVVGASLVGSLHCAGMCGPFAAFYSGNDPTRGVRRGLSHLAYHLGRLVTYSVLGALAGALGGVADLAGRAAGLGRVAAAAAGLLMIFWAVTLLLEHAGVGRRWEGPAGIKKLAVKVMAQVKQRPPVARALIVGLASTLLPCGWLYAFAVAAAGTGSAVNGAVVMLAFWAGTVPLLLGLGVGMQSLAARLRVHVPVLSAIALLAIGIAGVLGRLNAPAISLKAAAGMLTPGSVVPDEPPCHKNRAKTP
ncbi:MAG: sulfite exporter TauE/SafE family protein [Polyangiaceae bacterium]